MVYGAAVGSVMTLRPAPGVPIEEQPEAVVLRMLLWGEARGEGPFGMLAVLWVVSNRAVKADTTLKAQALKHRQFSCFNDDDPNRGKMLTAWRDDGSAWAASDAVCTLYERSATKDPTGGATHYYVLGQVAPAWGRGNANWNEKGIIGHHVFGIAG